MAHVHMFCDESGKGHSSDFVTFCGYLGNNDQWQSFASKWSALRVALRVPPIHMGAILHADEHPQWSVVKKRWGDEWDARREDMLKRFSQLIYDEKLLCVGAIVDCHAFKTAAIPKLRAKLDNDPHYLAFQWTITTSIRNVEWGDSDALLGLLIDDDYDKAVHCYGLLHALKKDLPEVKKRISGICFCNDEKYPGIQAADIIAHESRRLFTGEEAHPSERFLRLTWDGQHQPHKFDEKSLLTVEQEC